MDDDNPDLRENSDMSEDLAAYREAKAADDDVRISLEAFCDELRT